MKYRHKRKLDVAPLIVMATLLTACGGEAPDEHSEVTPATATQFTRIGIDVDPAGRRVAGDLGATVDASANITFKTAATEDQAYPYFFTFPSGLPGGSISGADSYTTLLGSANKSVFILAPSLTRFVQNVVWLNQDNESVYGAASAGYLLDPRKIRWPTDGTVHYKGKAIQYVVDRYPQPENNGYAVYTSEVSATINYASRSMLINVEPGVRNELDMWGNSSMADVDPAQISASLNLTRLNFAGRYLGYEAAAQKNGWGLGLELSSVVNFFGADAEELAGVVEYSNLARDGGKVDPLSPVTYQTISFALVKQ